MHVLLTSAPKRRFAAIAGPALAAFATAAHADLVCTFDQECLEGEACAETAFTLEIVRTGEAAQLVTEAETVDGAFTASDDAPPHFTGATPSATHLLTVGGPGASRYTVHLPDVPMGAHYSGTCEEAS